MQKKHQSWDKTYESLAMLKIYPTHVMIWLNQDKVSKLNIGSMVIYGKKLFCGMHCFMIYMCNMLSLNLVMVQAKGITHLLIIRN